MAAARVRDTRSGDACVRACAIDASHRRSDSGKRRTARRCSWVMWAGIEWSESDLVPVEAGARARRWGVSTISLKLSPRAGRSTEKEVKGRTDAGSTSSPELLELALVLDVAQVIGRFGAPPLCEAQLEPAALVDNVRDLILARRGESGPWISSTQPRGEGRRDGCSLG